MRAFGESRLSTYGYYGPAISISSGLERALSVRTTNCHQFKNIALAVELEYNA